MWWKHRLFTQKLNGRDSNKLCTYSPITKYAREDIKKRDTCPFL